MLVPSDEVLALRKATTDDLDDLADIACAAMPMDPQWNYRFPHREEFPEDNWTCTRLMYKNLMETVGNVINVVTVPSNEDGEIVHRSIALAVWELPGSKTCVTLASAGRRDADPKRMKAFTETLTKARKNWFDCLYGTKQLHLRILATHPDYQRRGAATQHCKWGMKLAKEQEVPITLFSSPLGQKLYSHVGFDLLATIIVQVEGEEEKLFIGVMIHTES